MSARCDACRFWQRMPFTDTEETVGECRAGPPVIVDAIVRSRLTLISDSSIAVEDATRFPLTKSYHGCGAGDDGSDEVPL